ncbi:hypothetical protein PSPO01_14879 [Paraphaeosphaeria sporulosa]
MFDNQRKLVQARKEPWDSGKCLRKPRVHGGHAGHVKARSVSSDL